MSFYGFTIPHHRVRPLRDFITIQVPYPPARIGSILTPDIWREISQHSHQAGIIRAMGPLAFKYKDGESELGLSRHNVGIGDWVFIKWGAGTMFQASKGIVVTGGWRYVSSFNDVIGTLSAAEALEEGMNPAEMSWDESDSETASAFEQEPNAVAAAAGLPTGVRERVVYK